MKGSTMFSPRTLCIAALASICLALPASLAQAQQAKVAVANTGRIFGEMEESRALNVSLQNELNNLKNTSNLKKTEIDNLKNELTKFKPESAQYGETQRQILTKSIEY